MALRQRSLFLYGYEVTQENSSLDFKVAALGPQISATLRLGFYSLSSLMLEIKRACEEADPSSALFTVTADRTIAGGTQNRVTIAKDGIFLTLLFATGTRVVTSVASLIGFTNTDLTGATTYTGTISSGTVFLTDPNFPGHDWRSPLYFKENKGIVNRSASGKKEAIVFQVISYFQVRFKYILEADAPAWAALLTWLIGQRLVEFTPEVGLPNVFYQATLESTADDGKGLGFNLQEMTPGMPGLFDTGVMKFLVQL